MATTANMSRERMNPREANVLEEARFRKIAIQNLQRDNLEAQSIWRDKQIKSYGNMIQITQETPLSKIITDEQQAQSQDEFLQKQHALANLNTIATPENAEYIIDRLDFEQIKYLNDNWVGLMRSLKKQTSRLDKNIFVNKIIQDTSTGHSYEDLVGQAGPTPAMDARSDIKASTAQEVAYRLAVQEQLEEDRRVSEEQAGLDLNTKRDAAKVSAATTAAAKTAAEQARLDAIAALTARNQTSKIQGVFRKKFLKPKIAAAPASPSSSRSASPIGVPGSSSSSRPASPVPAPGSVVISPPSSRSVSPMSQAAAQAVADAAVKAQIQAKADAALAASAGGNQTTVGNLVQVGPSVGNQIAAGGSSAIVSPKPKARSSTPPPQASPKGTVDTNKPNGPKAPAHPATDTDIAKAMMVPELSASDRTQFATQISAINAKLFGEKTEKLADMLEAITGTEGLKDIRTAMTNLTGKKNLKEDIYRKMIVLIKIDELRRQSSSSAVSSTGTGFRKHKRIIRGKGYTKNEHKTVKPRRHYFGEKYYIDLNKLDDNTLCVKYASNDANLPKLKVQQITGKTKEIICDILNDKFDDRIFKILTSDEKRMVNRFIKAVKLDITVNDDDEKEFQRQFEIVRGEYMSGNDSPQIKSTLKRYVLEALQENKIARNDAYNILYSLSL